MKKAILFALLLLMVGCGSVTTPTNTPPPSPTPIEVVIVPTDIPTDVIAEPSLPPGIELSPTPENFTPTIEPSSTPLNSGVLRAASVGAGVRVSGVSLLTNEDKRLVFAGINLEMYRDYANGCGWVSDGTYNARAIMADKVKALGVNAVRLNYSYRFMTGSIYGANLSRFLDMVQELASRGLYIMPSDHTYTGGVLTNAAASYPMMKSIIDGMRARGLENYLIMNPFNEPGPDISASQWVAAQKAVLTYLRNTAAFNGVVVLDGTGWATMLDVAAFNQVIAFDATLRGGAANVIFSMHLYPNIPNLPAQLWTAAKQVPLTVGELGQENPGSSPLDPQYVKNTITGFLNTGMPNGHNGLFAWIFAWCDTNKMLEDWEPDNSIPYGTANPLSSHGVLWRDNYYGNSKLLATNGENAVSTPIPTRNATIAPSPTKLPPTPTRTATGTPTPRLSLTPTNTPTPTNKPRLVVTGEFGGTPFSAIIEQQ